MTVAEFHSQLRATGAYETDDGRRRRLADRLLGRRSVWYYWKLAGIVWPASRLAGRGVYNLDAWAQSSYRTLRAVEECGGAVGIDGLLPRARTAGPVVYVANHMSVLETFLLPCVLLAFGDVGIVLKESLLGYPVLGRVMRAVRPVSISRTSPREDLRVVLEKGAEALAAGRSVLVFPQATRQPNFDPGELNSLGVKLARRGGVPVVALALKTDFHGIGRVLRDFGPIDVRKKVWLRFDEPLEVEGNGKKQHEAVAAFVARNLRAWGVPVVGAGA